MKLRQINSTVYPMTFLLIQSGNHILGATGVSPTVSISKNGGAFATPAGAVSEIGKGWYSLAANATDRNTLGAFLINATGVGIDQFDDYYEIVGYDPFAASVSVSGGIINTVSNVVNATGLVSIHPNDLNSIVTGVWKEKFNTANYNAYGSHTAMSGFAVIFDRTSGLRYTGQNLNSYLNGTANQVLVSQSFADSAANFIGSGVLANPTNKIYTDVGGGVVLAPSGLKYINPTVPTGVFLGDFDQKLLMTYRSIYEHREMIKLATGSGVIYTRDNNMNIVGVQSFTDDGTSQIQGRVR